MRILAVFPLSVLLTIACGPDPVRPFGDDLTDPPALPIELVLPRNSGEDQAGPVASYLAEPLVVRVIQGDVPVAGVPVRWVSGNPTVRVEPITLVSDANGSVAARFYTGTVAGPVSAIAVLGDQWLGIRATALPGPAVSMRPISSIHDTVLVSVPLFLRVRVEDAYGNGVPGVGMDWSMISDGWIGAWGDTPPTDKDGNAFKGIILGSSPGWADVTAWAFVNGDMANVTFHPRAR